MFPPDLISYILYPFNLFRGHHAMLPIWENNVKNLHKSTYHSPLSIFTFLHNLLQMQYALFRFSLSFPSHLFSVLLCPLSLFLSFSLAVSLSLSLPTLPTFVIGIMCAKSTERHVSATSQ
ncbi:hypothetical protein AAMO2058_000250400 [Amorphochlora amoebiformis]